VTPEVFEGVRWVLVLVLGYFVIPLKKKVDCNLKEISDSKTRISVVEANYSHIKESLDEIKKELKTLNGKEKR
jgi:chaperonin cofactor prefoldin